MNTKNKKLLSTVALYLRFFAVAALVFSLTSCASPRKKKSDVVITNIILQEPIDTMGVQNIYHTVARGETVYRISKMYGVDIETIKRVNNITNVRDLKIGQRLLIPRASPMQEAITLYPSDKWQYIIIHHSATDRGNCQMIDAAHKKRGWSCVGYHFVIDNGTSGRADGQIEVSPRWVRQEDGAHCKADNMNARSIGICVVGNFSTGKISSTRLASLIYLVEKLKNYYRIPASRVLGHNEVKGASTECPGRQFPWKQFHASLK